MWAVHPAVAKKWTDEEKEQKLSALENSVTSLARLVFEEARDERGRWTEVTSTRLENHQGTHNKFYHSAVYDDGKGGGVHVTMYGSLNPRAPVTTNVEHHPSVHAATEAHKETVRTRQKHGYEALAAILDHPRVRRNTARGTAENDLPETGPVPTGSLGNDEDEEKNR